MGFVVIKSNLPQLYEQLRILALISFSSNQVEFIFRGKSKLLELNSKFMLESKVHCFKNN